MNANALNIIPMTGATLAAVALNPTLARLSTGFATPPATPTWAHVDINYPLVRAAAPPTLTSEQVCIIGAKDAFRASFADVCDVPLPEATCRPSGGVSYLPVRYQDLCNLVRTVFAHKLDAEPVSESYALARSGKQMFGRIVYPWGDNPARGFQACLRSSYDRSIANQVAGGLNTFVCANGMMTGESMLSLKHTTNVGQRLPEMVCEMASRVQDTATALAERLDRWAGVPMGDDLFYAFVGVLLGRGMVTSTIANAAIRYWKACRTGGLHAEHSAPSLGNGFQAATGGLHLAHPTTAFRQYAACDHVADAIAASGGSLSHIPAFELDIQEY